jgi:hypothetical protein
VGLNSELNLRGRLPHTSDDSHMQISVLIMRPASRRFLLSASRPADRRCIFNHNASTFSLSIRLVDRTRPRRLSGVPSAHTPRSTFSRSVVGMNVVPGVRSPSTVDDARRISRLSIWSLCTGISVSMPILTSRAKRTLAASPRVLGLVPRYLLSIPPWPSSILPSGLCTRRSR